MLLKNISVITLLLLSTNVCSMENGNAHFFQLARLAQHSMPQYIRSTNPCLYICSVEHSSSVQQSAAAQVNINAVSFNSAQQVHTSTFASCALPARTLKSFSLPTPQAAVQQCQTQVSTQAHTAEQAHSVAHQSNTITITKEKIIELSPEQHEALTISKATGQLKLTLAGSPNVQMEITQQVTIYPADAVIQERVTAPATGNRQNCSLMYNNRSKLLRCNMLKCLIQ